MPTTINNNTWYYLPVANTSFSGNNNAQFINAETVLNTSSIYSKNALEQIKYGISNYIAIPNNNYGLVCGTRVLAKTSGTFNLNVISSSGTNIDCYYTANTNSALDASHITISGSANTNINNTISMNANTEYSIILVQQNTYINTSLFINTTYSGSNYPINSAFNGTIINNKFSY